MRTLFLSLVAAAGVALDQRFQNSNHIGLSEFQHLVAQTGEAELSGFMESVV
jgi:hypothetical protein